MVTKLPNEMPNDKQNFKVTQFKPVELLLPN